MQNNREKKCTFLSAEKRGTEKMKEGHIYTEKAESWKKIKYEINIKWKLINTNWWAIFMLLSFMLRPRRPFVSTDHSEKCGWSMNAGNLKNYIKLQIIKKIRLKCWTFNLNENLHFSVGNPKHLEFYNRNIMRIVK